MSVARYFRSRLAGAARTILRQTGFEISRYEDPFCLSLYRERYGSDVAGKKPLYNIGAGSFYHPYWQNVDYSSDWYTTERKAGFIPYDITAKQPLPIERASAEIFYTSHTVEHVPYDCVQALFKEVHRCLKPGGIFRVTTGPDAETDFRAFQQGDHDWFYWTRYAHDPAICRAPADGMDIAEKWLHHVASPLCRNDLSPSSVKLAPEEIRAKVAEYGFPGVLDHLCGLCTFQPERPGSHISRWTHERLIRLLQETGFANVYRSGYRQSVSPLLRTPLFDSTHPQISIYVEAIK